MTDQFQFGPHKISELLDREGGVAPNIFGVDVDVYDPRSLEGVKSIGLIAKIENGEFHFDVMDAMIQYRGLGSEIFVEVPFDFQMIAKDVLTFAHSVEAHIIVTPPTSKRWEDWQQWSRYTKDFLEALLELPTFSKEVLPITSYIEYMSMNVMGYQPKTLTDSPMMHEYFEKSMDVPTMDALKADLHKAVLDYYGGEQAFEVMVHSTLSAVHDSLITMGEKALTRIQEAFDNGNPEKIKGPLLVMLERKSFPSESQAIKVVEAAMEHPSDIVSGFESQLEQLSIEGNEEAVGAVADLISDLRQLEIYRKV